jgi:hypothetical protein
VPTQAEAPPTPFRFPWPSTLQWVWIVLLLGGQLFVSFAHKNQQRWTFPLTSFPMYSNVYAERPSREHRSYMLCGSKWQIETNMPLSHEEYCGSIWRSNYSMPWVKSDMRELAQQIRTNLERKAGRIVTGLTVEKTAFIIQPFPDNRVIPGASAVAYKYDRGKVTCLPWELKPDKASPLWVIEVSPVGLTNPRYRVGYYSKNNAALTDVSGTWDGNRFLFMPPEEGDRPYFFVIGVRDEAVSAEETLFAGPYLQ